MNGTEKVSSGLVVASCDAPVLLELCEEVLNQMTSLVQMSVVFALIFARGARWNHDGLASLEQRLDHASLSVVGLVGQYGRAWGFIEQDVRSVQIVRLSGRQMKARRIAQRIDGGVLPLSCAGGLGR